MVPPITEAFIVPCEELFCSLLIQICWRFKQAFPYPQEFLQKNTLAWSAEDEGTSWMEFFSVVVQEPILKCIWYALLFSLSVCTLWTLSVFSFHFIFCRDHLVSWWYQRGSQAQNPFVTLCLWNGRVCLTMAFFGPLSQRPVSLLTQLHVRSDLWSF